MKRALFSLHQVVITVVLLIMAALYSAPPVQAQTFTYVHTDALGSPVTKTNASKAIVSIALRAIRDDLGRQCTDHWLYRPRQRRRYRLDLYATEILRSVGGQAIEH
ncbi:hypothetical protein ASC94_22795 [Massilia sp. Root418]|uniref:hypothetical protein n=1 Tax=Massilia sp. Root418 TaxID=1736532 RepID=UPI0006F8B11B|nr:hypothetical protein [Massilia sp. Root418]KQW89263.1 hypothetical protein ASC94_22795 [Massilia sp. Root418]